MSLGCSLAWSRQRSQRSERWSSPWCPSLSSTATCPRDALDSPPGKLCAAIRELNPNIEVAAGLVWRAPQQSSRKGGTRDAAELHKNLVVFSDPLPRQHLVLVDDVITTGSHLQAAQRALADEGFTAPVALCAARTQYVDRASDEPFRHRSEKLASFDPDESGSFWKLL